MTIAMKSLSISAVMLMATAEAALAQQGVNVQQMGTTTIGSGCVGALSGFGSAIPTTICPTFGTWVLNTNANGQAPSSNSSPVVVSSNQTAIPTAPVAGINRIGYISDDLCSQRTKLTAQFSSNVSGGSIITGVSSTNIFICSFDVGTAAAANVSFTEGTGTSSCGTGTAGVWGNTSSIAANGWPFAANGGLVKGSGAGTVAKTATSGDNLCVLFTTSSLINVSISYVQSS